MAAAERVSQFAYAILRVVPRVERGEQLNAGVVLFCRRREFLAARVAPRRAPARRARRPTSTPAAVRAPPRRARADRRRATPARGPVAALAPSERFGWLVAPSSTIVQPSPVHTGLCDDPRRCSTGCSTSSSNERSGAPTAPARRPDRRSAAGRRPDDSRLAAAVCEAGGLGFLAAGYLTAAAFAADIDAVRGLTSRPFGVNVFYPTREDVDLRSSPPMSSGSRPRRSARRRPSVIRGGRMTTGRPSSSSSAERPAVVSFTFGCPDRDDRRGAARRRKQRVVHGHFTGRGGGGRFCRSRCARRAGRRGGRASGLIPRPIRRPLSAPDVAPAGSPHDESAARGRGRDRDHRGDRRRARGRRLRRPARNGAPPDAGVGNVERVPAGDSRRPSDEADTCVHRPPRARHRQPLHARARWCRTEWVPRDPLRNGADPCGRTGKRRR